MTAQRLYRLAILTLILLAFALRAHNLDAQSLWYDEGVTAHVAQFGVADLVRWTADDIQPPLYYLVVAGWGRLAGWSEWSLRFVSVFFGTLTIPLLAVLARRLTRSRTAAVLAALFAALHPALLYYSQEARMYAMLVALGVSVAYCVLRLNGEWRMANGEAGGETTESVAVGGGLRSHGHRRGLHPLLRLLPPSGPGDILPASNSNPVSIRPETAPVYSTYG